MQLGSKSAMELLTSEATRLNGGKQPECSLSSFAVTRALLGNLAWSTHQTFVDLEPNTRDERGEREEGRQRYPASLFRSMETKKRSLTCFRIFKCTLHAEFCEASSVLLKTRHRGGGGCGGGVTAARWWVEGQEEKHLQWCNGGRVLYM